MNSHLITLHRVHHILIAAVRGQNVGAFNTKHCVLMLFNISVLRFVIFGTSWLSGPQLSKSPSGSSSSSSAGSSLGSQGSGDGITGPILFDKMRRAPSNPSLSSIFSSSYSNVYVQIWKIMLQLASDPYPEVKHLAQSLVNAINLKVCGNMELGPELLFVESWKSSLYKRNKQKWEKFCVSAMKLMKKWLFRLIFFPSS